MFTIAKALAFVRTHCYNEFRRNYKHDLKTGDISHIHLASRGLFVDIGRVPST